MARKTIPTFIAAMKPENMTLVTCDGNDKFQPFTKISYFKNEERLSRYFNGQKHHLWGHLF